MVVVATVVVVVVVLVVVGAVVVVTVVVVGAVVVVSGPAVVTGATVSGGAVVSAAVVSVVGAAVVSVEEASSEVHPAAITATTKSATRALGRRILVNSSIPRTYRIPARPYMGNGTGQRGPQSRGARSIASRV